MNLFLQKINDKKRYIYITWLGALIVLSVSFLFFDSAWIFRVSFISIFVINGLFLTSFFQRLLYKNFWLNLFFANFTQIYILSFTIALFVNFYKYTDWFLLLSLWLVSVILFVLGKDLSFADSETSVEGLALENRVSVSPPFYLTALMPFIFALGWGLLFLGRTGEYIITPWQAIPKVFVYVFLLSVFLLVILLFSKIKVGLILFLIILHSYFLHSYLPLVYETGFGGDKWRHLASENFLLTEKIYSPTLLGEPVRMTKIAGINLPEVLVAGNKTSYGNQWGLTIGLSKFLQIDIFLVDMYLGFILWSFALPILFFLLAGFVYKNTRFKLLVAFLPTIFYTFQVFGSITIPVALGNLFFFFVLYLWLVFIQDKNKSVRNLAIIFTFLMYLGYVLNFIIALVLGIAILIWKNFANKKIRLIILLIYCVSLLTIIPFLEVVMGYGTLKPDILQPSNIVSNTADAFGTLSGLVAFIPRPTHIDQGNWLYNQTRQTQSQASLFNLRLLPFAFTVLVWLLGLLGIQKIRKLPDKKNAIFFLTAFGILLFSYIFSWYFMNGNHILARRLDLTIAFFWLIFIALGIFYLLEDFAKSRPIIIKIYTLGILLALIATSTYTSGPVLEVVTKDEVSAAHFIWQHLEKQKPACVIANTWPLLALEYVSGRQVIAGGFPVYLEYAQPERVKIFEGLIRKPTKDDWVGRAYETTGAEFCWYMVEKRFLSDSIWEENVKLFGNPHYQIGKVFIWKLEK